MSSFIRKKPIITAENCVKSPDNYIFLANYLVNSKKSSTFAPAYKKKHSGFSSARLECLLWEQEVVSSNLAIPTTENVHPVWLQFNVSNWSIFLGKSSISRNTVNDILVGKMAEWSMALHSKCSIRATVSRVRIPIFPQEKVINVLMNRHLWLLFLNFYTKNAPMINRWN